MALGYLLDENLRGPLWAARYSTAPTPRCFRIPARNRLVGVPESQRARNLSSSLVRAPRVAAPSRQMTDLSHSRAVCLLLPRSRRVSVARPASAANEQAICQLPAARPFRFLVTGGELAWRVTWVGVIDLKLGGLRQGSWPRHGGLDGLRLWDDRSCYGSRITTWK